MRTWLLPEYIEDILPPEALHIEGMRKDLLTLFHRHGYLLVQPPLLEYMESLLTGTGYDMELKTFKVVDQLSGRLMGLRADITPQVARIDAHLLNRQGVTRLCYAGSVLHTLPTGLTGTREPLQIGAELYGHSGLESDLEIQRLMLKGLTLVGAKNLHLDVGHVAIFRSLVHGAGLTAEIEAELFRALQGKDVPALKELTANLEPRTRSAILLLPELYGDKKVLDVARRHLPPYSDIESALTELESLGQALEGLADSLCFDLADLRGYHYHSGIVFAVYTRGRPNAIVLGGRYDQVGKAFGRARPATGFSMDLRELAAVVPAGSMPTAILAPMVDDAALQARMEELREAGEIVIQDLPGHESNREELNCDRQLVFRGGRWEVLPVAG